MLRERVVKLHVSLEQVLHGEGVGAGGHGAAVGARPVSCTDTSQQRAARAPCSAVPRAHVRRTLRLGTQRARCTTAPATHPHLALAAVRYLEVSLPRMNIENIILKFLIKILFSTDKVILLSMYLYRSL